MATLIEIGIFLIAGIIMGTLLPENLQKQIKKKFEGRKRI